MILFVVFLISTISVAEDYSIEGEWYSIYFDNTYYVEKNGRECTIDEQDAVHYFLDNYEFVISQDGVVIINKSDKSVSNYDVKHYTRINVDENTSIYVSPNYSTLFGNGLSIYTIKILSGKSYVFESSSSGNLFLMYNGVIYSHSRKDTAQYYQRNDRLYIISGDEYISGTIKPLNENVFIFDSKDACALYIRSEILE